jgi:hypothetical protein
MELMAATVEAMRLEMQQMHLKQQQLAEENRILKQANDASLARLPDVIRALEAQVVATAANARRRDTTTLVDNRGLGKPQMFRNEEDNFRMWASKTEEYILGVYPQLEAVLSWAAEHTSIIDDEVLALNHGAMAADASDEVEDMANLNVQIYTCLAALTDGESYGIVKTARHKGCEAWRLLHQRWDPMVAGRSRALLREIVAPARAKLEHALAAILTWEELVLRYEKRRDSRGLQNVISEDIKCSAVESLVPEEIERHLLLNASRLVSYAAVRAEVVTYIEARTGQRAAAERSTRGGRGSDAMDVDAFGKGGGSGRGKGKETKTCHHCGKVGHLQSECWAKGAGSKGKGGDKAGGKKGPASVKGTPRPDANKTCWNCGKTGHTQSECWLKKGKDKGKGKGKDKGKKYGAGSWDDEETLAIENGVAAFSAESLDMSSMEASSVKSTSGSWIRCCLDTGAARSAFPSNLAPDLVATPAHGVNFKTATAEIVPSEGVKRIPVVAENGRRTAIKGHGAPVHKVLVAGSGVVEQGRDLYLGSDGGYIMEPGFSQALRLAFAAVQKKRGDRELTPVYLENGVFNFYVKREAKEPGGAARDLAAGDVSMSTAVASSRAAASSGGPWQATAP